MTDVESRTSRAVLDTATDGSDASPAASATDRAALLALLEWQREMGADAVLDSVAVDWMALGPRKPGEAWRPHGEPVGPAVPGARSGGRPLREAVHAAAPAPSAPSPRLVGAGTKRPPETKPAGTPPVAVAQRAFPTALPDAAETAARNAAKGVGDLDELRRALLAFDGCGLKATAKNLCLYRGAATAELMIIGEAPGRDEDLEDRPFVGVSGRLLDRMLSSIDLSESVVHITNVVYWRPPGNRPPTPQEILVCRPFLERQIELVRPKVLLLLGGAALKAMIDTTDGIIRARGRARTLEIAGRRLTVMPTLHPAYLLRTPAAKRQVWRDLLAISSLLSEPVASERAGP